MAAIMLKTMAATMIMTLPFIAALQRDDECLKQVTESLMCKEYYAGTKELSYFCCLDFQSILIESPMCTCMLGNYRPPLSLRSKHAKVLLMVKQCNFSPQLQPSQDCYADAPSALSPGGAQLGQQGTHHTKQAFPHPDVDTSHYFPKLGSNTGTLPSSMDPSKVFSTGNLPSFMYPYKDFFKNILPSKGRTFFDFPEPRKDFGATSPTAVGNTFKPRPTFTNHGNHGSLLKPISIPVIFSVVIVIANLLMFPYFVGL